MDYRRIWKPGGTYFFTVNLLQRNSNALLVEQIDLLRQVVAKVKGRYPFIIHAWVVLPEHIHCVIELPPNDEDFSLRWRLIKQGFSKALPIHELSIDQILIPCAIKSLAARKPSSLLCRASQPSQRAPQLAIPVRLLSIKPPSLAIAM